jgi:hypothetical protein
MTKFRVSNGFAIAAAVCAVACSGAPGGSDPSNQEASQPSQGASGQATNSNGATAHRATYVPMPTQERGSRDFVGAAGNGHVHMVYRGGPVISNVKIYAVFWGSNVPNQSDLAGFYTAIANSAYVDQLSEYDTSRQKIGRGQFVSSYVDTDAPSDAQVSDDAVQQELSRLVGNGSLPQPDGNTLFMVHFPAGVTINMQNANSCEQFCAYHSSFSSGGNPYTGGGNPTYYAVMPDYTGDCSKCSTVDSSPFNDTTVVASHEVAEAITDPNIGVANTTQDEHQLGWYDDKNDEIGDVCEGQSATFAGYRVTKLWSNRVNACIAPKSGAGASH